MIIDLAPRLRQLRIEKHLRQDQIAALIGVEKSTISAYENDLRQPSCEMLVRFATLYRVSVDYLLGRTEERTIDISGLSPSEAVIVSNLVASMTIKAVESFALGNWWYLVVSLVGIKLQRRTQALIFSAPEN